jgi:cytochrome c553
VRDLPSAHRPVPRHSADRRLAGADLHRDHGRISAEATVNAIMQTIAGRLSAEEVASLAAYFGSLSHKPAK